MTLTIRLSDEHANALQARAAAEGLTLEAWLEKLAEQGTTITRPDRRHIWEVIAENMKNVPTEDFAAFPKDGLDRIDHYVYGVPKRTP